MKKIVYMAVAALMVVSANAQVDRTHAPQAGPAPKIQIAKPESFVLENGLKVFVVENHKLPRVSATLTLKLDPIQEKEKAGYVSMAGEIMRRGTTTRNKEKLDEEIDFLGGTVSTSPKSASASSLKKNFEKVFALMADVVLNPAFSPEELEKIRKQTLSGLESEKDDPNAIASKVSNALAYGQDHPYGEIETEATVNNITIDDVKGYYNTYWKPNAGYLVLVGDISRKEAKKLAEKYFSGWKRGDVPQHTYPVPQKPSKTYVAIIDRPASVQSVVNIVTPAELKTGSMENFPGNMMDEILGGGASGRLFMNLREKHAYTYGAYSNLNADPVIGEFSASASVRNVVTDSAVAEFMNEFNRIREQKVSEEELTSMKNYVSGGFARSLENPSRIAQFALNIELYQMPADYYQNYLQSVAAVTVDDVQRMAQKYVTPQSVVIVVVGNAREIAPKLARFGEVKYFDMNGNSYIPKKAVEIPAGVTAETVIASYLKAVGGEAKLKSMKDFSLQSSAEVQGTEMRLTQKAKLPGKYLQEVTIPSMGMTMQHMVIDGDKISSKSMGQEIPLDDKAKRKARVDADLVPELYYAKNGIKVNLVGVEEVNGKNAYAVEVTDADGGKSTDYFDTENGLKVKSVEVSEVQGQANVSITEYNDYRDVKGIKVPYELVQTEAGQKFVITVKDFKYNTGLKDTDFK